jgi:hypothetical protein
MWWHRLALLHLLELCLMDYWADSRTLGSSTREYPYLTLPLATVIL